MSDDRSVLTRCRAALRKDFFLAGSLAEALVQYAESLEAQPKCDRVCFDSDTPTITDDAVDGACAVDLGISDSSVREALEVMGEVALHDELMGYVMGNGAPKPMSRYRAALATLTAALADREQLAGERDTYRRAWNRSDAECERLRAGWTRCEDDFAHLLLDPGTVAYASLKEECELLQTQVERMTGTAITLETVVAENERLREELTMRPDRLGYEDAKAWYDLVDARLLNDPAFVRIPREVLEAAANGIEVLRAHYATHLLREYGGEE